MAICSDCNACLRRVCPLGVGHSHSTAGVFPKHTDATRQTCWICCKFSCWLEQTSSSLFTRWQDGIFEISFALTDHVFLDTEIGAELAIVTVDLQPNVEYVSEYCTIEIYFLRAQDWEKFCLPALKRPPDVRNDDWIAQRWIQNCIAKHEKCNTRKPGDWYPARLLLLTPDDSLVRLIHTKDKLLDAPYITLSHRWGTEKYETLTSQTMDKFQQGLLISSLPRTFQDAVAFARRIDIKYIWIDALCIKQDAVKHDLNEEITSMHQVYSNSLLNLSATLAEKGNEPLLGERHAAPFDPSLIYLRVSGRLRRYYIVDGDIWLDEIEEAPLQKRAWVFQERFLSPRVLHFGKRQLGWECNEASFLSLFPNGLPPGFNPSTRASIMSKVQLGLSQGSTEAQFQTAWAEIVSMYSKCDLTNSSDKLLAFSGVVKILEESRGEEYIAGMWKSTVLYDLAWKRSRTDIKDKPWSKTRDRAPSWSWLSVDGEIHLPPIADGTLSLFARVTKFPTPDLAGSSVASARGSIELKALAIPLKEVKWDGEGVVSFSLSIFSFREGRTDEASHLELEGTEDEVINLVGRGVLVVVPLFATQRRVFTLALMRVDSSSYRRVGTCQVQYREITPAGSEDAVLRDGWRQGPSMVGNNGERLVTTENIAANQFLEMVKACCLADKLHPITVV